MKKRKKTGDILLEMEPHLHALMDEGLQWSDLLFLIYGWLMVHRPGDQEEYFDGSSPEFYYGPQRKIKK